MATSSLVTPALNETTAPFQFDGGPVYLAGNDLAAENSAAGSDAFGFTAATMSPSATQTVTYGVTGTIYLNALMLTAGTTISRLYMNSVAIAGTVTDGLLGLYNAAGTRVAYAADLGAFTVGLKTAPLTASYVVPSSGMYWAALSVSWATTAPTFSGTAPGTGLLGGPASLAVAVNPFATNGTATTALPATITPSSNVDSGIAFWIGAR